MPDYLIIDGQVHRTLRGPAARRIRRAIKAEQDKALAAYDADPTPANRSALLTAEGIEAEVGRRLSEKVAA